MANLSISNIRERIFNTSKHEASVSRPANSVSNPFAANTFKGNVLTADVFETAKPKEPAFTGATKLKASALVGSLSNLGSKIQAGIESIAAFGRRMKEGFSSTWQKLKETEISFAPLKEAFKGAVSNAKENMAAAKSNMLNKWNSMFEKGITAKQIENMPIAEIRPMLTNEIAMAEDAGRLVA